MLATLSLAHLCRYVYRYIPPFLPYSKIVPSGNCALTGSSPFVISFINSMSGSFIMTWKCSMACMDLSLAQFLNQMTFWQDAG